MNPWDLDPNLYLPLARALAVRLGRLLRRWRQRHRNPHAAPACPAAGCRG